MKVHKPSPVDVIRDHHWLELSEYLGQRQTVIKETMKLWFTILQTLGYDLVRTGTNAKVPDPPVTASPPPVTVPEVSYVELYAAVEGALFDVTSRRNEGELISDQAEVRAIVATVQDCIAKTAPGSAGDSTPHTPASR